MASASHCHWLFEVPPPIFASADAAPRASSVPADALGMQDLQARRCNFDLNYRVELLSVATAEDFFLHDSRCACASCSRLLKHEQVWKGFRLKRRIVGKGNPTTKYKCLVPTAQHGLCLSLSLVVRGAAADIRLSGCGQFCASGCSRHTGPAGSTMQFRFELQGRVVERCCC